MSAHSEAMIGMARRITEILADATETAAEAGGVDHPQEMNLLVGTLLPIGEQLAAATALYQAVMQLHRLPVKAVRS